MENEKQDIFKQSFQSDTVYWTKLAKSVYGKDNEFTVLNIKKVIAELDNKIVGKLYDYRSRLLHNKKDQHIFNASAIPLKDFEFNLKIRASDLSLAKKYFKSIKEEYPNGDITLSFLSSWLIRKSFYAIEVILDALREEIIKNSSFYQNVVEPKNENGLMALYIDSKTNLLKPVSDSLWEEYKKMK